MSDRTSREAGERLAMALEASAYVRSPAHEIEAAATLRALLAERDALRAQVEMADALAEIMDKPDQSCGKEGRYHYDWQKVDDTLTAYYNARKATP